MFYIEAKTLVDLAIQHDILQTQDNCIAIYRLAGSDSEKYPEGWYLEEKESVYHDIMTDTEGQSVLTNALLEKGIDVQPMLMHLHELVLEAKRFSEETFKS